MGLHSLQVHLPAEMLAVDLAHVGDEEGFLLASLAGIGVDAANVFLQGIVDDCLCILVAIKSIAIVMDMVQIVLQNNR